MKFKLTKSFIACALLVIQVIGHANASSDTEACVSGDGRTRIVLEKLGNKKVTGITVLFDEKLLIQDKQLFGPSYCHVAGVVFVGKFLSYGDCGPADREINNTVLYRKKGLSWNLNEFDCTNL